MKRLSKVKIEWSANFAYAIGLITTDGCLSKNGRSIDFTSKDKCLVELLKRCLKIDNKITKKARAREEVNKYYRVQIGDINFYEFLLSIGLMPAKSKKLRSVCIPGAYFADFLRGCMDGDGNINISRHPESSHPQLRLRLYSASPSFLLWLKKSIASCLDVDGGWIRNGGRVFVLSYAKFDAEKLLQFIYYGENIFCLERKYVLARPFLGSILKLIKSFGFRLPRYSDII